MNDFRAVMDPQWLKAELEKPGRSQSDLARFLGIDHPSIINRMCKGTRQIKAWEADKIRQYLLQTEERSASVYHLPARGELTAGLPVRGVVEAGSWREAPIGDLPEYEPIPAPRSLVDAGAYALRVVGPSMDLRYPHGSMVVILPWEGGALPIGKRVVVERTRSGGLIETSIKELVRRADGELELWPRSAHPSHQLPIPFGDEDDVTLRLLGVVQSVYIPED
jgi:SOS-response transcriptional repressor LexA